MRTYDVIIIGAGSIGVPTALALAEHDIRVLVVDARPSPGQGENKHAIGGIRATHSDPAKIVICMRSLEVFATWQECYGDTIEWLQGGYAFPVYRSLEETVLRSYLPIQKSYHLEIDFLDAARMREVIRGINPEGLLGGTFSPRDGSASPLLAINAFYRRARRLGADFHFRERVTAIDQERGRVKGVITDKGRYQAAVVIDAAGAGSAELAHAAGCEVPVVCEAHEAGITEPVAGFCPTMVVDLRPGPGSKNYYFYQNPHGQVVFCITPDPPIVGQLYHETSAFLPQICGRMIDLLPRLRNIRVRRVWRGLYPMTGDGSPLVGWNVAIQGLLHAAGMCGQGFMLGPGLGEFLARMVIDEPGPDDAVIREGFALDRDLSCRAEALK